MTARDLLRLVEHLPEDSATAAAVRGGPQMRSWTVQTYLQALMANQLNAANHQRARKRLARKSLIKPPKTERTKPKVLDLATIRARQDAGRRLRGEG